MSIIPSQPRIVIRVRERDEQFMQIQELIERKRQFLFEKERKLNKILKENQFLEAVKSDYNKYYNYIQKQKMDQMKALQILNEYINDLTLSGKLTKHNIEDAKEEQIKILNEMKTIKKSLDSIMNNTKDIEHIINEKNN